MVRSVALPASQPASHSVTSFLTAALLVGVVDSFLPPAAVSHSPSRLAAATSYKGVNPKLADHVAAAPPASPGTPPLTLPPLLQVNLGPDSRTPHESSVAAVSIVQGRARSVFLPRVSAAAATAAVGYRSRCASTRRRAKLTAASLDHHDHDHGGGAGKGGRNGHGGGNGKGNGNGNGDGNGNNGGGESGGDDGFDEGRPLLLAGAGAGLAGALDGLKETLRKFRMPWSTKVSGFEGRKSKRNRPDHQRLLFASPATPSACRGFDDLFSRYSIRAVFAGDNFETWRQRGSVGR